MTGDLTFVVPVRHQDSVDDWAAVKQRLAQTLRSIAAQTHENWRCVVVANEGADLPTLPERVAVAHVTWPHVPLPSARDGQETRDEAVRADKGRRILAGLLAARPIGHVMVVDFDDFVSRRLSEHVAENPDSAGWYVDSGYVYDGGRFLYRFPHGFNGLCGTSLIVRSDVLGIPDQGEDADDAWVRRWLGSHVFLKDDLASTNTPLASLPFPGAVYRVGHRGNTSSSPGIRQWFFRKRLLATRPHRFAMRLTNLRPLDKQLRAEFFGGA